MTEDRFKFRYIFKKDFGGKTGCCYKMPIFDLNKIIDSEFYKEIEEYTKYDYTLIAKVQCTGLKDKNGKLIYEGDIIKDDHEALHYVKWNYNGFELNPLFKNGYTIGIVDDEIEVIGNIYENKIDEVLKDV